MWERYVKPSAILPRRINYGLHDLRGDLLGGLTASGVTLPPAMGYGVLSGLGPVAGLYGAVAVGIFGSLLGGTRGFIYGPNTAVTVVMGLVVADYADSLAEAATIGILAGLIQIVFGLLGLGRYATLYPHLSDLGVLCSLRGLDHGQAVHPCPGWSLSSRRHYQ